MLNTYQQNLTKSPLNGKVALGVCVVFYYMAPYIIIFLFKLKMF